jgi:hypothetical protein
MKVGLSLGQALIELFEKRPTWKRCPIRRVNRKPVDPTMR